MKERGTNSRRTENKKRLAAALIVIAMLAGVLVMANSMFGRYISEFKQTMSLKITREEPILAEKGSWYRGSTAKSAIRSITVVDHGYKPDETDEVVERFNADADNKGTIKAYIIKDADEKLDLIISGNGYDHSSKIKANVDSEGLFADFTGAESISGLDKVETGKYAVILKDIFSGCSNAVTISGTGGWNTSKAEDMSGAFNGCSKLTAVEINGWNTGKNESFENMFNGCTVLETANISGFDMGEATSLKNMFSGCSSLYSVTMPEEADTRKAENLSGMFRGTSELTEVNVSSMDTDKAKDLTEMFEGSGVQSLNLENWDTEQAENMSSMFKNCGELVTVRASQAFVVPENSTDDMFSGCVKIKGEHGTVYDPTKTDGEYARIDITNKKGYFSGETVTITYNANGGTGSKASQYVLPGVEDELTEGCGTIAKANYFYDGWNEKADGTGESYADKSSITLTEDKTLYVKWTEDTAIFDKGPDINVALKTLAGATGATTSTQDNTITKFIRSTVAPEGEEGEDYIVISATDSNRDIYAWLEGSQVKYYTKASKIKLNEDASEMFKYMKQLETIDCGDWDTSETVSFESFMYLSQKVTEADTSSWNTSNAENMNYMFCGYAGNTLDLSNFDTSKVTGMYGMFETSKVTSLNLTSFDTSNVKSMRCMFSRMPNITELNLTNFETSRVTGMGFMFQSCSSLVTIYAKDDKFVTTQVTSGEGMFKGCNVLTGGAGSTLAIVQGEGVSEEDSWKVTYAHEDSTSNRGYFTGDVQEIKYHSNYEGGAAAYTQNVPKGKDDVLTPVRFTREGYTFDKWNTSADGTGTDYANGASINLTADLELYAQWTENEYTVSYELQGGSWIEGYTPDTERKYTESLTLPGEDKLIREGYSFGGWYDNESGTGTALTEIAANTAENKTVYAKWIEKEYTVTYNLSGATLIGRSNPESRKYTEELTLPAKSNVNKTGYILEGWYENEDFSGEKVSKVEANTAENKEFYAKLDPIKYTVKFNSNGGRSYQSRFIEDIHATYDEAFTMPDFNDAFEKTGYTFLGYDASRIATIPSYYEGDSAINLTATNGGIITMYCIWGYDISVWSSGSIVNDAFKNLAGGADNIKSVSMSENAPIAGTETVLISTSDSAGKTYAWYEAGTESIKIYSSASKIYFGKDCSGLFKDMSNLTEIELDGVRSVNDTGYLTDKSTVNNISYMFSGCESLEKFPLELFAWEKIENVTGLFSGCSSMETLRAEDINTANISRMAEMFKGCSSLKALNLTSWDTSKVTDWNNMFTGTNMNRFTANKGFAGASTLPGTWYDKHKEPVILPGSYYASHSGTIYKSVDFEYATFITGPEFNAAIKSLAAGSAKTKDDTDELIKRIVHSSKAPEGTLGTDYIEVSNRVAPVGTSHHEYYENPIYAWYEDGKLYYYSPADILFTSDATDGAYSMFLLLTKCEFIDLSDIDTSHTKTMKTMFGDCYVLKELDLSGFDTSVCTDMGWMFYQCNNIKELDVSVFDTTKVSSMQYMFSGCTGLKSLNLSSWNENGSTTGNVTNMSYMFNGCSGLTSLNVSNLNTSKVTTMAYMFGECSGLTSLDVSAFNTSVCTTMSYIFTSCTGLASIDITAWNKNGSTTKNVTKMNRMFNNCKGLTSVKISNLDTSKNTTFGGLFWGCTKLATIDVTSFDTHLCTDMSNMFNSCPIKTIDVRGFDTSNVTTMTALFSNCKQLESVDVSGFNTSKCQGLYVTFGHCEKLKEIDVSNFDTSKATTMQSMFNCCYALTELNLTSFSTSNVTNMATMFNTCSKLQTIYASKKFVTTKVTEEANYANMFTGCNVLVGGNGTTFAATQKTGKEYARLDLEGQPGYFTTKLATYSKGSTFNAAVKTLAAGTPKTVNDSDNRITAIKLSETAPAEGVTTADVSPAGDIVAWYDNGTVWCYSEAEITYLPEDCSKMFTGLTKLETVDIGIDTGLLNTEKVTNVVQMYKGCSSIESLRLNNLNVSNVTGMSGMFEGCTSLKDLHVEFWNTKKATDMSNMFKDCTSLGRLNISGFNTAAVTNSTDMFANAKLSEVDTAEGVTGSVRTALYGAKTTWYTMIQRDADGIVHQQTEGVALTEESQMAHGTFYDHGDVSYATLDAGSTVNKAIKTVAKGSSVTSIDTYDYTVRYVLRSMVDAPSGVTTKNIQASGTVIKVWYEDGVLWYYTTADNISFGSLASACFYRLGSMVKMDISGWNTSNTTNMQSIFASCYALRTVDVSEFDTSSATNLSRLFSGDSVLNGIDVSGFDTSQAMRMEYMFYNCQALTSLDVSDFDTSQVTNMSYMFSGDNALSSIDVSGFNTSQVTSMTNMFQSCSSLTSLNLSHWNTSKVTSMCGSSDEIGMFTSCSNLTTLDVTGWDTSKVTSFYRMFERCSKLSTINGIEDWNTSSCKSLRGTFAYCPIKTLDLSRWDTSKVTTMHQVFYGCTALTTLNVSTWNTSACTIMQQVFYNCPALTAVDVSNWNTSNVTSMYAMFYNCKKLKSLNVGNWNTAKVTTMYCMFYNCQAITAITGINNWNTANVTNMTNMFYYCSSLTSLDLSHWNTSNVTTMCGSSDEIGMFTRCSKLTTLNLSGWNTSKVKSFYCMFYVCSALPSLDVSSFDTSACTSMYGMFSYCQSVTTLDLSHFDTHNCTNMCAMFNTCSKLTKVITSSTFDTSNVTTMQSMFQKCTALTSIDISNCNTSKVANMSTMFNGCTALKSIYASDSFVTTAVTASSNMFASCSALTGGYGTTITGNPVTAEYARIDAPDKPGYFTRAQAYNITYSYDDTEFSGDIFVSSAVPGEDYPIEYVNARGVDLPKQEDGILIVPSGYHLDGWLVRTSTGWSTTPVYRINEGESGGVILTPNWIH